jgi:GntR family transcriptional regulator, rspAB operon transcriptional repressor
VQVDRCRVLHLPLSNRRQQVIAEHAVILEALAERRGRDAERAIQVHLDGVLPGIEELLAKYPSYFHSPHKPARS